MRNFFFGFLIILGAVLVTHTANNSTLRGNATPDRSGATTVSSKAVACSSTAREPAKSGTNLVANGQFLCDSPGADNLWMTVTLQHKASDTDWVAVATSGFHEVGAGTTSSASTASRTRGVQGACGAGTYRTVVETARISRGNTKTYKSTSGAVTNPCG
jgi:hypothetical protein